MEMILQNTDRIEMSMTEFLQFTQEVVKYAIANTHGDYMTRNQAISILGSKNKLQKAIESNLIHPERGERNQKWKVLSREVIEASKIINKL